MMLLMENLKSPQATLFEGGLAQLGQFLGFEADRTGPEKGAADSVWHIGNALFIGLEAKSNVDKEKAISISDARQVSETSSRPC